MFVLVLDECPFEYWNEKIGGCVSRKEATEYPDKRAAQDVVDSFGHSHEGEMIWDIQSA